MSCRCVFNVVKSLDSYHLAHLLNKITAFNHKTKMSTLAFDLVSGGHFQSCGAVCRCWLDARPTPNNSITEPSH